jgi:hypothetical protein
MRRAIFLLWPGFRDTHTRNADVAIQASTLAGGAYVTICARRPASGAPFRRSRSAEGVSSRAATNTGRCVTQPFRRNNSPDGNSPHNDSANYHANSSHWSRRRMAEIRRVVARWVGTTRDCRSALCRALSGLRGLSTFARRSGECAGAVSHCCRPPAASHDSSCTAATVRAGSS